MLDVVGIYVLYFYIRVVHTKYVQQLMKIKSMKDVSFKFYTMDTVYVPDSDIGNTFNYDVITKRGCLPTRVQHKSEHVIQKSFLSERFVSKCLKMKIIHFRFLKHKLTST